MSRSRSRRIRETVREGVALIAQEMVRGIDDQNGGIKTRPSSLQSPYFRCRESRGRSISRSRSNKIRETVHEGVAFIAQEMIKEVNNQNRQIEARRRSRRSCWVRSWIAKRNLLGASALLLREWAVSSPRDYRDHLRMSEPQFEYLLERVSPQIQKRDTWFREALPARTKLEMSLHYLASGDCFDSLSALYRVPECTFSVFFPEVCRAVYESLKDFIQVCVAFGLMGMSSH